MELALSQIAELIGGRLIGDPQALISGVAPFETAGPGQITVAGSAKYLKRLAETRAEAVIVAQPPADAARNLVVAEQPMVAFARLMQHFFPQPEPCDFIHPRAVVDPEAVLGRQVSVGPCAVIGRRAVIGDRVRIGAGVVIEEEAVIGDDVRLHPNVCVLARCRIGSRVVIHAGTVIGSDGFGFAPDGRRYHKIPHTGIVVVGDDVEIGANNTIDRATFGETLIGNGVKTDNLVHVAHNVRVGDHSVLVSQVGISGSVTIGRHVVLAGQAGVAGHLKIGDGAVVGPRAGVAKDVAPGEVVMGAPEMPHKLWLRVQRVVPLLPELKRRLEAVEKRLRQWTPHKGD